MRIFISAEKHLKHYRNVAAEALRKRGYEPDFQERFELESSSIQDKLRNSINTCAAMICLVGNRYGAEPSPPTEPPCSYTQMEYEFACKASLPVFPFFTNADTQELDTSLAPEDSERAELQRTFRDRVRQNKLSFELSTTNQFRNDIDHNVKLPEEPKLPKKTSWSTRLLASASIIVLAALGVWLAAGYILREGYSPSPDIVVPVSQALTARIDEPLHDANLNDDKDILDGNYAKLRGRFEGDIPKGSRLFVVGRHEKTTWLMPPGAMSVDSAKKTWAQASAPMRAPGAWKLTLCLAAPEIGEKLARHPDGQPLNDAALAAGLSEIASVSVRRSATPFQATIDAPHPAQIVSEAPLVVRGSHKGSIPVDRTLWIARTLPSGKNIVLSRPKTNGDGSWSCSIDSERAGALALSLLLVDDLAAKDWDDRLRRGAPVVVDGAMPLKTVSVVLAHAGRFVPRDADAFKVDLGYPALIGCTGDLSIQDGASGSKTVSYEARGRGTYEWEYKYKGGALNDQVPQFSGVCFLTGLKSWGERLARADDTVGLDLRTFLPTSVAFEARVAPNADGTPQPIPVSFFVGSDGYVWSQDASPKWVKAPLPESLPRLSLDGVGRLTSEWREFEHKLDFKNLDALRRVVVPFGFVISPGELKGQKYAFEIRNVRFRRSARVDERGGKRPVLAEDGVFLIDRHYVPSGIRGDVKDVAIAVGENGAYRFRYRPSGAEPPHEWDYKFVNGLPNEEPARHVSVSWLSPANQWGQAEDGGYDLRELDPNRILFKARSLNGPANVRFSMGGVSWVWARAGQQTFDKRAAPYPDSVKPIHFGIKTLGPEWQKFECAIPSGTSFRRLVSGFSWSMTWADNGGAEARPPEKTFDIEVRAIQLFRQSAPVVEDDIHVYRDAADDCNRFHPTGLLGDCGDLLVDELCESEPFQGKTCIRVAYSAKGKAPYAEGQVGPLRYAGVLWQSPANNFGRHAFWRGFGQNLTECKRIVFAARAEKKCSVEFRVGGVVGPFGDSLATPCKKEIALDVEWREFGFPLEGDLSHVITGFGFVLTQETFPEGLVFYLDNVRFTKSPL